MIRMVRPTTTLPQQFRIFSLVSVFSVRRAVSSMSGQFLLLFGRVAGSSLSGSGSVQEHGFWDICNLLIFLYSELSFWLFGTIFTSQLGSQQGMSIGFRCHRTVRRDKRSDVESSLGRVWTEAQGHGLTRRGTPSGGLWSQAHTDGRTPMVSRCGCRNG